MSTVVQFALLGLGPGAIYALAGCGVVLIHRGSGVLNFAHGAQALLAAEIMVLLWQDHDWPVGFAIAAAVAISAALGAFVYVAIMSRLHDSAPVVRIIATVGLLALIQQGVVLGFGTDLRLIPNYLPSGVWEPIDGAGVGYDRLTLLAVAIVLSGGLAVMMRRTTFGLATTAIADNHLAASALGHSPHRIATYNWALGSGLAGLAGALIVPITGLGITSLVLLVVPALAAALLARFTSFLGTLAGAILLGIGQSLLTRYVRIPGGGDAFVFFVIVAVTVVRGSAIPSRDEVTSLLPRVGRQGVRPMGLAAGVVLCLLPILSSARVADALTTMALLAILALSLVVLTGLAGQVSLGQVAIAGFAGWAAARSSNLWGWPFLITLLIGVVAAVAVSVVFAVPAMRSRGSTLAVATLGLALAVQAVVFANPDLVGGFGGTRVEPPTLFGYSIRASIHPQRYAVVVLIVFVLLALALANLRAGRVGRRLLAIRSNERAAAAIGVHVARVKIAAFALASAVAGLGGVLMAFRFDSVVYSQFDVFASLNLVSFSVIGGIGYIGGAAIASFLAPGGIVSLLTNQVDNLDRYLIMGAGAILIVTLIQHPNGVADTLASFVRRKRREQPVTGASDATPAPGFPVGRAEAERIEESSSLSARATESSMAGGSLTVRGLSVTFGTVRAVAEMDICVEPGRIVGLIGPNGAGKTTLIDAISGFVKSSSVEIDLDGNDLAACSPSRRSRLGLGRCFQTVELFDDMTVRENLLVASEHVPWHAWLLDLARKPPADRSTIDDLVRSLGLEDVLDIAPPELSYGDRKLVGVARALATKPSVLMLDEPAAGLNTDDAADLATTLRRIADTQNIGVLLVEHDVAMVASICDEIVVMEFGHGIASGTPTEVLEDARVIEAYLGSGTASTMPDQVPA